VGIVWYDAPIVDIKTGWLAIFSVIACFIGFIAYLFTTVCANVVLLVVNLYKIIRLNIKAEVNSQKDDISRFQEELNTIDQAMKEENLGNFTFGDSEGETND
jgi:hypothetical protein